MRGVAMSDIWTSLEGGEEEEEEVEETGITGTPARCYTAYHQYPSAPPTGANVSEISIQMSALAGIWTSHLAARNR